MPRTIWIIAGESSGDTYGARLTREFHRAVPDLVVRGMGGDAMAAEGVDIMVDATELGVVGLVEVLKHLPMFLGVFRGLVRRAAHERPDAVVLIDYPGFNLRFAKKLHRLGIPVVYYVSPQVWAWGRRRIPRIAELIDKMLVIFPFEADVYAGTGLDTAFVGHPLLEILAERRDAAICRDENVVVLLPGSRASEVDRVLPTMLRTAVDLHARRPELRFVCAAARPALACRIEAALSQLRSASGAAVPQIAVEVGRARELLQRGAAGLAASGTVTVEAAILGLPLVVYYRLNWLTYHLARRLVKIPHFTMVNLVAGRMVFEEFLQDAGTPAVMARAVEAILPSGARRAEVERGMAETVAALGGTGASARAAQAVLSVIGL